MSDVRRMTDVRSAVAERNVPDTRARYRGGAVVTGEFAG
jgi:hypothetical protein